MSYQAERGGGFVVQSIARPNNMGWENLLVAMDTSLTLQESVNQSRLVLCKAAHSKGDAHLRNFLIDEYLLGQEPANKIQTMAEIIESLLVTIQLQHRSITSVPKRKPESQLDENNTETLARSSTLLRNNEAFKHNLT